MQRRAPATGVIVVCGQKTALGHAGHTIPSRSSAPHALRHTAASAWLSAGTAIVAVAAWLGDTAETVHRTYAHLMPDADVRERKAMNQFFKRTGDERSAPDVPQGGTE